jgi:polysaccharide export outer membrane protein
MTTRWAKSLLCLVATAGWALGAPPFPTFGEDIQPLTATVQDLQVGQGRAGATALEPAAQAYRIQPGDTVSLSVLGAQEYSGSYAVRADGTILFRDEMLGAVTVGGSTVRDAQAELASRIGEYVKEPTISLAVTRFKVMVIGEVREPGQYELAAGTSLSEAIVAAGGAKNEPRDLGNVYLSRGGNDERRYDLHGFKERGDASQNPLVGPGDRICVGRSAGAECGSCRVSGAVTNPGSYPLGASEKRVGDLIEEAGRWDESANPSGARLLRADGSEIQVNLTQLDEDPRSSANVVLKAGDELFVPRNGTEVHVLGGVFKPGRYMVASGTTLLEAISTAGGLSDGAVLGSCAVIRTEPEPERISVDLQRLMKQGDMSQNPTLCDRDVVFVPVQAARGGSSKATLQSVTDTVFRYVWMFRYF